VTAPAAPVITFRAADISTLRLRWAAVTGAATYNVYRSGVQVQSGLTNPFTVVQCGPGEALTVTAVNAGAEESVPSNTITVGNMGTANSFPPGRPRGPYNSNPFG
jgi:chitin-binding protein